MRYEWRNNSALIVHNLSGMLFETSFDVGLGDLGHLLIALLGDQHRQADERRRHTIRSKATPIARIAWAAPTIR